MDSAKPDQPEVTIDLDALDHLTDAEIDEFMDLFRQARNLDNLTPVERDRFRELARRLNATGILT